MLPDPWTNYKRQNCYQNDTQLSFQNEPKFNGFHSRNNIPKITDGAYVINLDEFKSVIYFDSFEVEHIPKEIKTST